MNQRGWTWDSDSGEEHCAECEPLVEQLAQEWNQLHNAIEQEGFNRQACYENGVEEYDFDFETAEEEAEYKRWEANRVKLRAKRLELIEVQLSHLGARMMREYEHWNEDEALMQYLERDREGE